MKFWRWQTSLWLILYGYLWSVMSWLWRQVLSCDISCLECRFGIWFKFFLSCTIPEFNTGFPSHLFMMTGHQAIFCRSWKGRVEVWYSMWSLWHPHDHPSCHILQHEAKGNNVIDQILDSSCNSGILPNFKNIKKQKLSRIGFVRFPVYPVIFLDLSLFKKLWLYTTATG